MQSFPWCRSCCMTGGRKKSSTWGGRNVSLSWSNRNHGNCTDEPRLHMLAPSWKLHASWQGQSRAFSSQSASLGQSESWGPEPSFCILEALDIGVALAENRRRPEGGCPHCPLPLCRKMIKPSQLPILISSEMCWFNSSLSLCNLASRELNLLSGLPASLDTP